VPPAPPVSPWERPYASLGASLGQQIGALVGAVGERVEPFPPALDLETASAALEAYLG
jgi:hypothetical protein